ncbi:hypothetical protein [Clostridium septicum]|uniref:Uncharacterized protein n=1 Tax=Clostridium septicum TaxID=1504 RepID=A0A9N7PIN1_CLOSE|nr:hypothetical protein [Clostridium septicum]AYE33851.1 hypothetical protein CP523_04865 [Clostridium septicum]MDU1314074.1 hypothetical protein [Clostridium septicum]QAS61997.1 hypothetical protein EI377_15380 [Clostridium septicum]UEC21538.1 hypothetical protein LK444_03965 [Clostridium septicum]USS00416.1 hypothetical protein NH397_13120 [Clostridium septicum]
MLKNKYVLYPESKLESKHEIEMFCKNYFTDLGYTTEIVNESEKFYLYLKINDSLFRVHLRLLGPALDKYKIPLDATISSVVVDQQLVIEKIDE